LRSSDIFKVDKKEICILKKTLLIADDIEMNRVILKEAFSKYKNADDFLNFYTVLEAKNGLETIEYLKNDNSIVIVLLDIIMPQADGFFVLEKMKEMNMLQRIPVIFITGEADSVDYQRRGYKLGVTDIISKPFVPDVVCQRVKNAIELYETKNNNEEQVRKLTKKIQHTNDEIINGFSAMVESRNKESKWHILHIRELTEILMDDMARQRPGEFRLSAIDKIVRASAVHDIGKYMIPDNILNKPLSQGRLTPEEFAIMKSHTTEGWKILNTLFKDILDNDPAFFNYCRDITRWHHERWDGRGYPDGLKGDEIPIWSQIVSIADVYDALVGKRCYKNPFSHETALKMIFNGECGAFNPELLDCLNRVAPQFKTVHIMHQQEIEEVSSVH